MNPVIELDRLRTGAVRRRLAILALAAIPLVSAAIAFAARMGGTPWALAVAAIALVGMSFLAWRLQRDVDPAWVARRLDASTAHMEDSAALLFADADALSELQRLQRTRIQARLAQIAVDVRQPWPWSRLSLAFGIAVALSVVAALWSPRSLVGEAGQRAGGDGRASKTTLTHAQIDIAAPAYTRIPARTERALDAKAPEGSRLTWNLTFSEQPKSAVLVFHDGSRLTLNNERSGWHGERVLTASLLYRIEIDGVAPLDDAGLHRLDAVPDRAPEVRVVEPEKTLSLLEAGQKSWNLAFETRDDYGIASATLQITLAQGGGENVKFKEQTLTLNGVPVDADGDRHLRYRHTVDLAALGIGQGDDAIVRLVVSDNRQPQANVARSASFILRWPAPASNESAGLEGVVQKTMPAYFRSQRQIIIDSEALLADKPTLDADKFLARADAIGADQKILRLRYGQFLGEESETHEQHAQAHPAAKPADDERGGEHAEAHAEKPEPEQATFGEAGDIVAEFGHTHDSAEAATLLDPETKATLKSALAEMWQAELHLRLGKPDEALPFEHRALAFIKQVQQSTRIYLARVGLELPQPDEARRLSGERKGLGDRSGTLVAAQADGMALTRLWRSLDVGNAPEWDAAQEALRARESRSHDALGAMAAIDRARRDPTCASCRAALRAALWPLLSVPAAASAPRLALDAMGRAYIDALESGERAKR